MIKLTFTNANLIHDYKQGYKLVIDVDKQHNLNELQALISNDKKKVAEIKQWRKKRSLDANSALWLLLDKMAIKLLTTKEELYEQYIKQYGVSDVIGVAPQAVDRLKQHGTAKYYTIKQKRLIGDKTVVYVELHYGSSTYDTQEMARLLDHVIEDGKELGIELISKSDRDLMLKEWEK